MNRTRNLCCRLNGNASSFEKAAENLKEAAQIQLCGETLRQVVEAEGKRVVALSRTGDLPPGWTVADCQTKTPEGREVTRVYLGSDAFTMPTITDAEKQSRRKKVRQKRQKRGKRAKALPAVKEEPGSARWKRSQEVSGAVLRSDHGASAGLGHAGQLRCGRSDDATECRTVRLRLGPAEGVARATSMAAHGLSTRLTNVWRCRPPVWIFIIWARTYTREDGSRLGRRTRRAKPGPGGMPPWRSSMRDMKPLTWRLLGGRMAEEAAWKQTQGSGSVDQLCDATAGDDSVSGIYRQGMADRQWSHGKPVPVGARSREGSRDAMGPRQRRSDPRLQTFRENAMGSR